MRHAILFICLFMFCCTGEKDEFILGTWKIEEVWRDGMKTSSDQIIEFNGTGKYTVYAENEIHGFWSLKNNILVMRQPEIKDLHGNTQIEPFQHRWNINLVKPYLIMGGTAASNTQSVKLVLKKTKE